ncbi:MAG TPA: DUF3098 domain-containing protein [Bacteroidia bacterium]|jgi:hypothetical protein|nr:DUF3098 domain-containing protein [Bacteroidia bacterium]
MNDKPKDGFALHKENYFYLIAGVALVVLGFYLMHGGGSEDPTKFNPEIFSTRRITVAPILILCGYIVVLIGIMKKPKIQA